MKKVEKDGGQDRRPASIWLPCSLWHRVICHGGSSRDRVTIDLRGIGDAARFAAAVRGQTVAAFARQALVAATGPQALAIEPLDAPAHSSRSVAKVHLRMDEREAEV